MTLALLIGLAVGLSVWRASRGKPRPKPAAPAATSARASYRERELAAIRDRYVADDMSTAELEERVSDALERPAPLDQRTEIHVYDAPPGHQLHIHLP